MTGRMVTEQRSSANMCTPVEKDGRHHQDHNDADQWCGRLLLYRRCCCSCLRCLLLSSRLIALVCLVCLRVPRGHEANCLPSPQLHLINMWSSNTRVSMQAYFYGRPSMFSTSAGTALERCGGSIVNHFAHERGFPTKKRQVIGKP